MPRTVGCSAVARRGRQAKAEQFYRAAATIRTLADDIDEVADAYATLLVHAGIAASDVICCVRLGEHSAGASHADGVRLLTLAVGQTPAPHAALARDLQALLGVKTKAGYSERPVSGNDLARVERAADRLVDAMRELSAP